MVLMSGGSSWLHLTGVHGGERSRNILSLDYYSCKSDNYATATANTMVVGRLLSFLVKKVQPDIADTLKTFCIGHSLGGHICGFAGKHYR